MAPPPMLLGWYRQYDAHKDDFIERYGTSTEQWLFHGCKSTAIDAIIKDCFNRSHAVRFAAGQGIYFATQASTSLGYTQPTANNLRHMFMARVLVGRTTAGNQSTRVCPPGFDTTGGGTVFVTYHDAQAYVFIKLKLDCTMAATYGQRQRTKYRFLMGINGFLLAFAIFIIISMSIYWGFFEEWTIWTDYTMAWVEFNFFIYYWDRLTITRAYLSLIYIYGFALLTIIALQIHSYRRRNAFLMQYVPYSLLGLAIITILGGLAWFAVTMINMNAGFLTKETFLLERLRFKGNAFKELKYREQAFHLVTSGRVPPRVFILTAFVNQRQRDFSCCGWNSYLDYTGAYKTDLPDTCCHKYQRNFGCGKNMLINPDSKVVNTRGCGPLMHYWYRRGFWENIFMSLFGVFMGVYMIYVFQQNRKEFVQLRDEADDRKRIIHTQSMASLRSANKNQTKVNPSNYAYTGMKTTNTNDATGIYDSDDDSASVLYEPRPMNNFNN
ncbi:unnamed protein product [Rotaria socialis]|uniref:Poly [ADP-ribose] polymerase n=1 Tax=Rotaria socialis TaxID=392032 RepID=A0A818GMI9_9BILA|nr:unnamed protein product [Rotaria socialis]CAF3514020.1 unnamed protein product [Rotaria socialis]CAF4532933.1 unnamed protein product [Rotaria socialis]CAF4760113.1 unnamed protein product [Rotaria socialis]